MSHAKVPQFCSRERSKVVRAEAADVLHRALSLQPQFLVEWENEFSLSRDLRPFSRFGSISKQMPSVQRSDAERRFAKASGA